MMDERLEVLLLNVQRTDDPEARWIAASRLLADVGYMSRRLSDIRADAARQLRAGGWKMHELGALLGVSKQAVAELLAKKEGR